MKTRTLLFCAALLASAYSFAQAPAGFNYQAVVRDGNGTSITNQNVSYRFNILQGSATGTTVYSETHSTATDGRGLVDLVIGQGSTFDDLTTLTWAADVFFLNVELDENGGSNYTDLGTQQLISVPYALHAETATNVDDADASASNELQTLSVNGSDLSISNGNTVTLPSGGDSEAQAKAWVHVPILGNPNLTFDGFNITNVSHSTTGVYVISFAADLFSIATNPAMVATVANDLAPGFAIPTHASSPSQVTVRTYDASGTLTNKEFSLVVFGK